MIKTVGELREAIGHMPDDALLFGGCDGNSPAIIEQVMCDIDALSVPSTEYVLLWIGGSVDNDE